MLNIARNTNPGKIQACQIFWEIPVTGLNEAFFEHLFPDY
jgi:hypothetical protein